MALNETVAVLSEQLQHVKIVEGLRFLALEYIKKFPLKYPYVLGFVLAAILVFMIIIYTNFVRFPTREEKKDYKKQLRFFRFFIVITRSITLLLLFVALAAPYTFKEKQIEGEPAILVLSDASTSFQLLDPSLTIAKDLKSKLEKRVPTSSVDIASGLRSPIGDGILGALHGDDSVIVVSDGYANYGRDLGDVLLLASKLNTTINALDLAPQRADTSVTIQGPGGAILGSDIDLVVSVSQVGSVVPYKIIVDIDGIPVITAQPTGSSVFPIAKKLEQGPHKITATLVIDSNYDSFSQNNVFYKTVHVLPKPHVLFVAPPATPLTAKLQELYEVTVVEPASSGQYFSSPEALMPYAAIIVDNVAAGAMNSDQVSILTDYVTDGGGLFVVGGENSFDLGSYKDSVLELLLPVKSGKGEKKPDDKSNVVIVIDISGSTGAGFGPDGTKAVDVEKALAVKVLDDITDKDRVGVVAFNSQAFQISPVTPLKDKKQELISMISSLKDGGGTNVMAGIIEAERMLINIQGSNNIILISDGVTTKSVEALARIKMAQLGGIKTYAVGVGGKTNEKFMSEAANVGGGIYFQPSQEQHLKILFGDPEDKKGLTLTVLNENHFITKELTLSGEVTGFNQVVPKSSANMLITTAAGDPLVTVWRFGLGRVAALSTDDGHQWGAALLSAQNAKVFTRIINWVIGDPSKTRGFGVFTEDIRLGDSGDITLRSDKVPHSDKFPFEKIDTNTYRASFTPRDIGFYDALGNVIAVSYPSEYEKLGINPDLKNLVSVTGGEMFTKDDVDSIVEKAISTSKRKETQETSLRWPFLMAALVVFLFEVLVRKIRENM
ncbi:MAG: VWA domain-containing protein [Candidatus Woesearchaeota archaeon]|nr:VWA domain-containing protein [Candidatus Woesearchaeota archaeon]